MNDHFDRDDHDEDGYTSQRDEQHHRGRYEEDRYRASGGQNRGQRDFGRGQEGFGARPGQYSGQGSGQREYRPGYNQGGSQSGYNQGGYNHGGSRGGHNEGRYGQGDPGGYNPSISGQGGYARSSNQGGSSQRNYRQGSGWDGGRGGQSGYRSGGSEDFGFVQRGYGPSGYGASDSGDGNYDGSAFGRSSQGYQEAEAQRWRASDAERGGYANERSRSTSRNESSSGLRSAHPAFGGTAWSAEQSLRQEGHYGRGPKGYTRSDERIREDVSDRLSDDDEVDASDITVTVLAGEVTLDGSVPDRRSKHRAEDIADSVTGVKDVHNSLRTRKGLMREMGDRLTGRDEKEHGHSGSGTRNSGGGASHQNESTAASASSGSRSS